MRSHFPSHLSAIVTFVLIWTSLLAPRVEAQDREYSYSFDKARQRKTLIRRVKMLPSTIKWQNSDITIGDAWLEKNKNGRFYLCFHIDKGKDALWDCRFVVDEVQHCCSAVHFGTTRNWVQVVFFLDSPDISKLRFSLIRTMSNRKEKRLKNIRFVPIK